LLPATMARRIRGSTASSRADAWEILTADLEGMIPRLMAKTSVPGLSIALIADAKLRWRRGFGVRDGASKAPVDDETTFEAASMSKPVFAYAVMKLCERGVLELDTPLTQYTSEPFLEGDPRLKLITARHVLSHSCGFQNWRSDEEPLKIHFNPGGKFLYSGEGYSYLQSVVARLTHKPIDSYMKANLFVPFGMTSSGFTWNDLFEKRMASPHDRTGKPTAINEATAAHVERYGAAGELRTTPTDYSRFLIEIIDPKEADAYRLGKNSLQEMIRPQVAVTSDGEHLISWALGWRLVRTKAGDLINYGGENPGFQSFAEASVRGRTGFVIMTNGENGAELLKELAPFVANRLHPSKVEGI
jgi:CubicO group peptidase (beta-lactamase class C family)